MKAGALKAGALKAGAWKAGRRVESMLGTGMGWMDRNGAPWLFMDRRWANGHGGAVTCIDCMRRDNHAMACNEDASHINDKAQWAPAWRANAAVSAS